MSWWIYLIHCSDDSYYCGISTDPERRFQEHLSRFCRSQPKSRPESRPESLKGARYFQGREPLEIVYREAAANRSEASRREHQIKKLSRKQKIALIQSQDLTPKD